VVGRPSLLQSDAIDACPNCGVEMPGAEAIVCTQCGFDLEANAVRRVEVGETEDEPEQEPDDFCPAGWLGWMTPTIAGAVAIAAAAIIAAINAPERSFLAGLHALAFGPIYAGLGLAAAVVTARLLEQRFGRVDLAAARMLLAVGLFQLSFHVGQALDIHNTLEFLIGAGVGFGLYALVVWVGFAVNQGAALILFALHLLFWIALEAVLYLDDAATG